MGVIYNFRLLKVIGIVGDITSFIKKTKGIINIKKCVFKEKGVGQ